MIRLIIILILSTATWLSCILLPDKEYICVYDVKFINDSTVTIQGTGREPEMRGAELYFWNTRNERIMLADVSSWELVTKQLLVDEED